MSELIAGSEPDRTAAVEAQHEQHDSVATEVDGARALGVNTSNRSLTLAHVASANRCYPGESLTLFTSVSAHRKLTGFLLWVRTPVGAEVTDYAEITGQQASAAVPAMPTFEVGSGGHYVAWRIERNIAAGAQLEFQVSITVPQVSTLLAAGSPVLPGSDIWLDSKAEVTLLDGGERLAETVTVAVLSKGALLQYLPALYERDSFMGRFLMLFESFWRPVDLQLNNIYDYFDPDLMPAELLPWLASWFDLTFDDDWSEDKRRHLLASAVRLFRKRGTRQGLVEMLQIFTGSVAEIKEHRADNLRLGKQTKLGQGVALGRRNQPHTFSVRLRLPPLPAVDRAGRRRSADELERMQRQRLQRIRSIIDLEKPAHVTYALEIDDQV